MDVWLSASHADLLDLGERPVREKRRTVQVGSVTADLTDRNQVRGGRSARCWSMTEQSERSVAPAARSPASFEDGTVGDDLGRPRPAPDSVDQRKGVEIRDDPEAGVRMAVETVHDVHARFRSAAR